MAGTLAENYGKIRGSNQYLNMLTGGVSSGGPRAGGGAYMGNTPKDWPGNDVPEELYVLDGKPVDPNLMGKFMMYTEGQGLPMPGQEGFDEMLREFLKSQFNKPDKGGLWPMEAGRSDPSWTNGSRVRPVVAPASGSLLE